MISISLLLVNIRALKEKKRLKISGKLKKREEMKGAVPLSPLSSSLGEMTHMSELKHHSEYKSACRTDLSLCHASFILQHRKSQKDFVRSRRHFLILF